MSDPMHQRPDEPPPEERRKSASPLIWILILIALIAFGWYFYNQRTMPDGTSDALTPPPATSDALTPAESSSAEKEPDAGRAAKPEGAAKVTRPKPVSREVALIEQPQPEYPIEAARAREEGTVLIQAQVDALGNVSDVEIARRSGSRTLDRAAMREVRRWKFRPAMEDGRAVASSVQVPVDYRLEEESQ